MLVGVSPWSSRFHRQPSRAVINKTQGMHFILEGKKPKELSWTSWLYKPPPFSPAPFFCQESAGFLKMEPAPCIPGLLRVTGDLMLPTESDTTEATSQQQWFGGLPW